MLAFFLLLDALLRLLLLPTLLRLALFALFALLFLLHALALNAVLIHLTLTFLFHSFTILRGPIALLTFARVANRTHLSFAQLSHPLRMAFLFGSANLIKLASSPFALLAQFVDLPVPLTILIAILTRFGHLFLDFSLQLIIFVVF